VLVYAMERVPCSSVDSFGISRVPHSSVGNDAVRIWTVAVMNVGNMRPCHLLAREPRSPSRSGRPPVDFQPWRSTPPSPCIHPSYVFPTCRPTPQLTSDQPTEDPSPLLSSRPSPPPPSPHPTLVTSNTEIEIVIQMTALEQDRLPIPKDTRTRLFVGNVRSFSLILLSSLTEIAASLSSSLAGPQGSFS